ncbi:hypothetical protein OKA04_23885 [Luteolibacter flavescens]|uniref:Uncharacterized protein n=1 Tax=Luteolibacter flavescens TaxID=1859460 RepID=A0ABT3FXR3_9BACT|nr:hypothetical protein [Luteolibacter flavescens]MCW1887800.1 hypothetical protein [Luteolibacter flavescens]
MNDSEDKMVPSTWIPWIMALAVVFGWSSFSPDHLATRRERLPEESGLIHQSDDTPAPGIQVPHLAGVLPEVVQTRLPVAPPVLLGVAILPELPVIGFRREGIQGRAPPVRA